MITAASIQRADDSDRPDSKRVGSSSFTEFDSGTTCRRLLMVRLAVTQYDNLFAPDQLVQPLTTTGD